MFLRHTFLLWYSTCSLLWQKPDNQWKTKYFRNPLSSYVMFNWTQFPDDRSRTRTYLVALNAYAYLNQTIPVNVVFLVQFLKYRCYMIIILTFLTTEIKCAVFPSTYDAVMSPLLTDVSKNALLILDSR